MMPLAFRPITKKNAIKNCVLSLQFVNPADPTLMEEIRREAQIIAKENDLPSMSQLNMPQFFIGSPAPSFQSQFGVAFQRFAPDGNIECDFRCESQLVTIQVQNYTSWSDFIELVKRTVVRVSRIYLSIVPAILVAKIQYDDVFVADFTDQPPVSFELFKPNSKWLAIHDPNSNQQWHSHFGMFFQNVEHGRELVNVNASASDSIDLVGAWKRSIALTIVVGENYDVPGQSPLIVNVEQVEVELVQTFNRIHVRHKQILEEVLANPYLDAIGAKA